MSTTPNPPSDDGISAAIAAHRDEPGALLPILHDIQDRMGYVPAEAVPLIAAALNLSRAEVHGVITFYHHFRQHPGGRHTVHLCRAEACQARGAEALIAHAKAELGCDFHGTTADGTISLEPVFCLGHCASGPSMMIDEEPHAGVTSARFDALTRALRTDPRRHE